jgi:ABC-type dipeptide/oligopeptide/nickel transport system permease component
MDTIYSILIFIAVLILYSQIIFQLKKGDDVEIYETDYTTNKDINANANLKQPFVFQFGEYDSNLKSMPLTKMVAEQGSFDVYVKEVADYHADRPPTSVVLSLSAANSLMKTDTEGKYFSSGNQYFIEETGIQRYYQQLDKYL